MASLIGHAVGCGRESNERQVGMGPLHGIRVIEMAGLAPIPFAGMTLAPGPVDRRRFGPVPRRVREKGSATIDYARRQ